jgi:hypothetical protein
MFAVATVTTISCILGRQYRPILNLTFLDFYVAAWLKTDENIGHLHILRLVPEHVLAFNIWLMEDHGTVT